MLRTGSAADVSLSYFTLLIPGIAAGEHTITAVDPVPAELDAALKKIQTKLATH